MSILQTDQAAATEPLNRWHTLADQVLNDVSVTREQAGEVLASRDDELLDLIAAAFRIRRRYFGNQVQLYFLMNAKSGLCPEDCHYCSQSKIAETEVERYNFLSRPKIMEAARQAKERNSRTFCLVISGRSPSEREMQAVETIVPEIKAQFGLHICACLGLLSQSQAERLKACGVDRVNHNLNTSSSHYEKICTTHSYQDRMDTLQNIRHAGLEVCCGGIIGMGEQQDDKIDLAFALRDLRAESIPLNFLNSIDGTPLEQFDYLNPRDCLRTLAMFRFVNPSSELRIAGGREIHLRALQPLGLYIANSIFVGDYLTTKGQPPEADYRMIEDLGFEVVLNGAEINCGSE
ncbi:MAG TPA: biotin synthase BioB [Pirellulaceae bacterium]|nr:biotin synthase BioB [Pirellulaceae bacterium]HMO91460.1 biotin synthase BioB [Pirellulaceae bacterium]HMP69463.1 biotin synthase BioB [Pirellulaceae bacterium]